MNKLFGTFLTLLALCVPVSPVAAGDSLYDHNGSDVIMSSDRINHQLLELTIFYDRPHSRLYGLVRPGDTLFTGFVNSINLSVAGRAWVFSSVCGPRSYDVRGNFTYQYRQLVLRGGAPTYGQNCQSYPVYDPVINHNAELRFYGLGVLRRD